MGPITKVGNGGEVEVRTKLGVMVRLTCSDSGGPEPPTACKWCGNASKQRLYKYGPDRVAALRSPYQFCDKDCFENYRA